MARYNEILVGRYNRFLQKLFGMKGTVPTPSLGGEIQAQISMFSGVEHRYLESWERFAFGGIITAVAAQNDLAELQNPAGSNMIVVMERVSWSLSVADVNCQVTLPTSTAFLAANLRTGSPIDTRGRKQPTAIIADNNNVAGPVGNLYARINMNQNFDYALLIQNENQEITILPGTALRIQSAAVNTQMLYNFTWRERLLEEAERA